MNGTNLITVIKSNEGKAPKEVSISVREAVESRPGFTYLAAGKRYYLLQVNHCMYVSCAVAFIMCKDFKSIELRFVAHLSQDPRLLALLNTKENSTDVFTLLASKWYRL